VGSPGAARIQYRQLLDLMGRMPPHFALPAAALDRLDALDLALPAMERATMLRDSPASLRHPALILRLAAQEAPVAAAAIAAARLDDWQWSALVAELPLAARGHLRHRRDLGPRATAMLARFGIGDLGLPHPEAAAGQGSTQAGDLAYDLERAIEISSPAPSAGEGIGAIVKRIEAYRRARQAGSRQFDAGADDVDSDAPRLPLSDIAPAASRRTSIRFASDLRGRISWADGGCAPMLAGVSLGVSDSDAPAHCDARSARALGARRPVVGGRLQITGAPAIAGAWRMDAAPRFDAHLGHFEGYRGVLRRTEAADEGAAESPADRLRQLLHELRTPINAIQGFAELIQQQLFGPTPHQYRSLSASIAADSAAVLAGFDEIERLVMLETSGADELAGHADLAALVRRGIARLEPAAAAREVSIAFDAVGPAPVAIADEAGDRLLWRLLTVVVGAAGPGEALALELSAHSGDIALEVRLPSELAALSADALFVVQPAPERAWLGLGLLGSGFALRLARAEARAVGGDLEAVGGALCLRLPGLTPSVDDNSSGGRTALRSARA
jgi:hypothetical protein